MITNDWLEPMKPEFSKPYYRKLYETVKREYPEAEALFGTATAGIAHAAIAAQLLGLPMGYVRGKAKDHGRKNRHGIGCARMGAASGKLRRRRNRIEFD